MIEELANVIAERDRLREECKRMRPVYDAAKAWRSTRDRKLLGLLLTSVERHAALVADLIDTVDAAVQKEIMFLDSRTMPTSIDQRRLKDGATALAVSSTAPQTRAEAEAQLSQVSDGIRAMQSLDDLGEEGNRKALRDLDELQRRYTTLQEQIKRWP